MLSRVVIGREETKPEALKWCVRPEPVSQAPEPADRKLAEAQKKPSS